MTSERQRDVRAQRMVANLIAEDATPERVLKLLCEIAHNRRNLDYTPHLVTALREARLLLDA